MQNIQAELDRLRERIAARRNDTAVLEDLRLQEEACRREAEERNIQWNKEQRDVDRLETVSLSSIWAALRGSKDEDMDRERAEAYAARLRYQEAERQLAEVRSEILERQRRIREAESCEAQYEALMREKEARLRTQDPTLAEKLAELERREMALTARRKELGEAVDAGRQALFQLDGALGSLDDAEGWGTWDVFGGGLLTDMMKYDKLDEAQRRMAGVQSALRRYQAELADVAQAVDFTLQSDGFLRATDIWFDNIFSDMTVLDNIRRSRDQLWDLRNRIDGLQRRLEADQEEAESELASLRQTRNEAVFRA